MEMRAVRVVATGALVAALFLLVLFLPAPSGAQELTLSTPYPAVVVAPGGSTTFEIRVSAPGRQRVDLRVAEKPEAWEATLRGGGFVLNGVFTDPEEPPEVLLEVDVPEDAQQGVHQVVVTGTSAVGSDTLTLDLRVSRQARGGVTLTAEFPGLRGPSDATFNFELDLANNTPEETTFVLEARGPQGWLIEARPRTQEQAATVTVEAGATSSIVVEVDPPDDAVADVYPILVRAVGGGRTAETELRVEITGNFAITFTTPDERLNAEVTTGGTTDVPVVIRNDGTAPLVGITLTATPPSGWDVSFRPESIDQLAPGQTLQAVATIRPSEDAVAGDYVVTMRAEVAETRDEIELRTTVKTSSLWGVVGILLIVGALGGLGLVFRRYGRR